MPSVTLAGLAAIILTGGCSASSPVSVERSQGGTSDPIILICTPAPGAEVEGADRICSELLDVLNETRPDLRFVAGASGLPAARFVITYGTSRGLGMEATWVDAAGASTAGKPLAVAFFDRGSDPELRRGFYAAFLRENPIPF